MFCGGVFDWDKSNLRYQELENLSEDPTLWDQPDMAQGIMKEKDQLKSKIEAIQALENQLDDIVVLIELSLESDDEASLKEAETDLEVHRVLVARRRLESLLSGEADHSDCFLEVHAGAGGTEAQDWALILSRMYTRWAESKGYKLEWLEESPGEEAGIKSVTLRVSGLNAYGWLKTESGVHRLVRISPFDSAARRHTSFASVWVYPVVDDSIDIEVLDKDLRIDTYRASGAGGQHVNKTDSAIRITHIPTGIVVQCQNDRSQHRNRATAFTMLRARLYELELQRRAAETQSQNAAKTEIGWGHQIRSYVLQPYQMVKDTRTGVEVGNAHGVLDGNLDPFLEASLAQGNGEKS